jgi:hypothetical protein
MPASAGEAEMSPASISTVKNVAPKNMVFVVVRFPIFINPFTPPRN